MTTNTIAVVGATGAQGGGLVRAILSDRDGGFAVRAITRNADGEKAAALRALGAEVVAADLDDAESLRRAFHGVYGAYCLTNFWEHFSVEKELRQAQDMAQAAKDEGLRHVVWSTLEDTRKLVPLSDSRMPTLMGRYKVPHFDGKGEADHLFAERGVPTTSRTCSSTSATSSPRSARRAAWSCRDRSIRASSRSRSGSPRTRTASRSRDETVAGGEGASPRKLLRGGSVGI